MVNRKILRDGLTLVAVTLLSVSVVRATTLLHMDLADLTSEADVIALVQAGGASCQLDPSNERWIYTYREVTVDEIIKGDRYLTQLTVKTPGGELGTLKMEVPGAPALKENGTYILFLYQGRDDYESNVVGWQGVFAVENGMVLRTGQTVDEFLKDVVDLMNANER